MKTEYHTCDKCGKKITNETGMGFEIKRKFKKKPGRMYEFFQRAGLKSICWFLCFELCDECAHKIESWINAPNEENVNSLKAGQ